MPLTQDLGEQVPEFRDANIQNVHTRGLCGSEKGYGVGLGPSFGEEGLLEELLPPACACPAQPEPEPMEALFPQLWIYPVICVVLAGLLPFW